MELHPDDIILLDDTGDGHAVICCRNNILGCGLDIISLDEISLLVIENGRDPVVLGGFVSIPTHMGDLEAGFFGDG